LKITIQFKAFLLENLQSQKTTTMRFISALVSFLLLTLVWTSCEDDPKKQTPKPKDIDPTLLVGNWVLTGATVNKIPTSRLDSAYLNFTSDTELKTNILGEDISGTYSVSVKEKKMTQDIGRKIDYKIEKLVSDSLILSMKINSKKYKVLFEK